MSRLIEQTKRVIDLICSESSLNNPENMYMLRVIVKHTGLKTNEYEHYID